MNIEEIKKKIIPILEKYHVKRAGIFGSVSQGVQTSNSDVDVLVELGEKIGLLQFVRIKLELENSLGTKVDLVEYRALKPRLKDSILSEEIRLYG